VKPTTKSLPRPRKGTSIYAYMLIAFLAIATAMLLLANLFSWRIFGHSYSVQTGGNVAEWVAGVGTVAAIFSGIWVFVRGYRATAEALRTSADQLRLSQLDFRSRELQWKAAQAAHVVAWTDVVDPNMVLAQYPQYSEYLHDLEAMFNEAWRRHMADLFALNFRSASDDRPLTKAELAELSVADRERLGQSYNELYKIQQRLGEKGPMASGGIMCVLISNSSDAPVFALEVETQTTDQEGTTPHLLPAEERVLSIPVLPPGPEPRLFPLSRPGGHLALYPTRHITATTLREVSVSIRFTDSAGTPWTRHGDGRLQADGSDESRVS
jgi:hypothetical protein